MKKSILFISLTVIFLCLCLKSFAGPSQIIDLTASQTNGGVVLSWTVPASVALITNLDVRYSTGPISVLNWSSKSRILWLTSSGPTGTKQTAIVTSELTPGFEYYFAIRTQDNNGSWSSLSFNNPLIVAGSSVYSLPLAWDQAQDSTVTGYNIYYGTAPGSYTSTIDVGNVTHATVTGLTYGVEYYFAATAYDTNGAESDFSNMVRYP